MFATPRLRWKLGGEVHARRKVCGGRENRLSRRETRCIRGPCRAHHNKVGVKVRPLSLVLLYEHLSLSESDKDSTQFAHGLSKGARQPYQRPYRKTAHQKWMAQEKVTPCRNRPLARSARRYKGVIGESKEGIGGPSEVARLRATGGGQFIAHRNTGRKAHGAERVLAIPLALLGRRRHQR